MDAAELLRAVWQRKVTALITFVLVCAAGAASLFVQSPVYQATSTLALIPSATSSERIFIISQIDVITPLYAEAARTRDTRLLAQELMGEVPLGEVGVRTFRGAPIVKIDVRSGAAASAQLGAQAVTDALLERVEEGDAGLSSVLEVSQIETPALPADPIRPQPRLTLLVTGLMAAALALAAAVVRSRYASKVETADDVMAVTGIPVFGEIPNDRSVTSARSAQGLVSDPRTRLVAEAVRDVRTNLQFTNASFRSVLVTSPEGSHGKSFLSFALAATLASGGARTVLVDGDLRRGVLAERYGVPASPGLMEVLRGARVSTAISRTDLPDLWVLPGGKLEDDPGELLEREFFPVLYDLEAAYDVVVIDGTPLVPINDARVVARYTTVVLLVVSAGTVTRRQLRVAVNRLSIIGIEPTAVVLNNVRERRRPSYYRYLKTRRGPSPGEEQRERESRTQRPPGAPPDRPPGAPQERSRNSPQRPGPPAQQSPRPGPPPGRSAAQPAPRPAPAPRPGPPGAPQRPRGSSP